MNETEYKSLTALRAHYRRWLERAAADPDVQYSPTRVVEVLHAIEKLDPLIDRWVGFWPDEVDEKR